VNCAALPGDVLEAELFGQEQSVTVNGRAKPGKLELCDKGTLFLDEITEMPLGVQAKLLHVLQDGYCVRSGGDSRVEVDVRIVAATEMNVEQALAERKLREDIYYRLSAFTVHVPPLRQRKDEIPLLLAYFMNQLAKRYALPPRHFSRGIIEACQNYAWPGNLRELEKFVKRYLVAGDEGPAISFDREEDNLPETWPGEETNGTTFKTIESEQGGSGLKSLLQSVKGEAERNAIATALEQTRWNRKAAARLLKVSYRTLLYKIQQYHMSPPGYSSPFLARNGLGGNES
jgi:DNA-binding NtrC family response regulator